MPLLLLALLALAAPGCAAPGPEPEPLKSIPEASCGRAGVWCGGQSPAGCWCDAACLAEGDCCEDASTRCDQPARLRVAPRVSGPAPHPVFVDLAPSLSVESPLEVVPEPEGLVAVTTGAGGGRTYLVDGWRRRLEPLAWLRAQATGTVTLRLQTRAHPVQVLAEAQLDVDADSTGPSLSPCTGLGDIVVTEPVGHREAVALTGRLEAFLRPDAWLEVRHPATDWRLGLGPGAKVMQRGRAYRTSTGSEAPRNAPKLLVPRTCLEGEVRLDALTLSDRIDGVALAWSLRCEDGTQSRGCAWVGDPEMR